MAAAHHDDVIVLQVPDDVLEHLPFADLVVEFSVGHSRCRAPLPGYFPGRGGHLLAPLSAGRREARGRNGDVDFIFQLLSISIALSSFTQHSLNLP